MKRKSSYWLERASRRRLVEAEKTGLVYQKEIVAVYEQALKNVNRTINSIYANYADSTGLDVGELSEIIKGSDRADFLRNVQNNMRKLGFNINDVYSERYLARLSRMEALKQQVYWEIAQIAPQEMDLSSRAYKDVIKGEYAQAQKDHREAMGLTGSFSSISNSVVSALLAEKWANRNYSDSIWANISQLAGKTRDLVGAYAIVGSGRGKSPQELRGFVDRGQLAEKIGGTKKAQRILKKDGINALNKYIAKSVEKQGRVVAERLFRTELNYFRNQATLQAMKDDGFEEYRFDAVLDGRTSDVCESEDGNIYKLQDAQVGINYPPLHVNCRSGVNPVLDIEEVQTAREPMAQGDVVAPELPTKKQDVAVYNQTDVDTVRSYQGGSFRHVNEFLRGGSIDYDFVLPNGQTLIDEISNLDRLIEGSTTGSKKTLYRGIATSAPSRYEVGTVIMDKAYSSFTKSKKQAEFYSYKDNTGAEIQVVMEFDLPKGSNAIEPYKVTGKSKIDEEFLLPRNTRLKVVDKRVEGDILYLKMKYEEENK